MLTGGRNWTTLFGKPYYFFYYYVTQKYTKSGRKPLISQKSREYRQLIWDFKDGDCNENLITKIVQIIREKFSNPEELTFVCIPASSRVMNELRYRNFSKKVCFALRMTNAFEFISVVKDRVPAHEGGTEEAKLSFSDTFFQNKRVLIFDDLVTKGSSMFSMMDQMEMLGAQVVGCLSLGRTHDSRYVQLHDSTTHPWSGETVYENAFNEIVKPLNSERLISSVYDSTFETNKSHKSVSAVSALNIEIEHNNDSIKQESAQKVLKEPLPDIGTYVTFGSYYGRPLHWEVLEQKGQNVLLMTKHAVLCRQYNQIAAPISWDRCSLRSWLNKIFYEKTFNDSERSKIIETEILAEVDETHELNPGENTRDKVFLLSISEYERYFLTQGKKWRCLVWDKKKQKLIDRQCWLRNYGCDRYHAAFIGRSGSVHAGGSLVESPRNAVRPLIWVRWD